MSSGERKIHRARVFSAFVPAGTLLILLSALPATVRGAPFPMDLDLDKGPPRMIRAESVPNPHDAFSCGRCHETTDLAYETAVKYGVKVPLKTEGDITSLLCEGCHGENPHFFHPVDFGVGPLGEKIEQSGIFPLESIFEGLEKMTCATCHIIHFPNTVNHLLRGFPRSKEKPEAPFSGRLDFCRGCHGEKVRDLSSHWDKVAAEKCNLCHQGRTGPDVTGPLKRNINESCVVCHPMPMGETPHFYNYNPFPDFDRNELPTYGLLLDRGQFTCTTCHVHHRPPETETFLRPGFISVVSKSLRVNPHRTTRFCQNCHPFTPPPVGTPGAVAPIWEEDMTRLCRGCHSKEGALRMSHPLVVPSTPGMVPEGWATRKDGSLGCQTCHLAGHGPPDKDNPKMLRHGENGERNDVCFRCHDRGAYQGRNIHEEVADFEGCDFCHVVKEKTALRPEGKVGDLLAEPTLLCLLCHSPVAHPAAADHTGRPGRHSFVALDDNITPLTMGKVTCHSCHDSHSPDIGNKFFREADSAVICHNCHPF